MRLDHPVIFFVSSIPQCIARSSFTSRVIPLTPPSLYPHRTPKKRHPDPTPTPPPAAPAPLPRSEMTTRPRRPPRALRKRTRARPDRDWIPSGRGYSLYLRPTVISTHPYLGLSPPDSLLLYVITSPVGPYYATGFDPVRLTTDTPYVRAWPGGSGSSKIGGNYGPTMMPGAEAQKRGYSQILWIFGEEEYVTEVGAMNVFFLLEKEGKKGRELVTPPLTRGDILPGVTRQSILELTKTWGEFDVVQRSITMSEIRRSSFGGIRGRYRRGRYPDIVHTVSGGGHYHTRAGGTRRSTIRRFG